MLRVISQSTGLGGPSSELAALISSLSGKWDPVSSFVVVVVVKKKEICKDSEDFLLLIATVKQTKKSEYVKIVKIRYICKNSKC